jgi:hypothetical protein
LRNRVGVSIKFSLQGRGVTIGAESKQQVSALGMEPDAAFSNEVHRDDPHSEKSRA